MEGVRLGCEYKKNLHPRVCIIVLNYNNFSDTVETLKSVYLMNYKPNSLLLVENSTDKAVIAEIRSLYPSLEIKTNEKNLGYAGGNNVGMRIALERGADYIFIVNNDIILEPDVLQKLVVAMETDPDCAASQPLVAYAGEKDKIWSAGTEMYLGYPRLFKKGKMIRRNGINKPPFGLVGCALLFRAEALKKIGLFDESLFLLQEETEWCMRAKKMGFSLSVVSDAVVYHKVSATLVSFSKTYLYYIGRNWLLVGKKHLTAWTYSYILLTELMVRIPYYFFQLAKRGQTKLIRFYLQGLIDGVLGISGHKDI